MSAGPLSGSREVAPATSATGSIYDLGYRGYDGPRLGRRHAIAALFRDSLRACFGFGRSGRAKVVPIGLTVLALLPALVAVGLSGLAGQLGAGRQVESASPVRYETYWELIAQLVFLFAAAQGPELLGRDMRHNVLSLLFSRALRRADYVAARAGALVVALLVMQLLPQALIFVGRVLASDDLVGAVGRDVPSLLPAVGQALLASLLIGSVALAIASYTPRRAYATAAIVAAFVLPPLVATIVRNAGSLTVGRWLAMLSVPDILGETNGWLFDVAASRHLPFEGDVASLVALGWAVLALGVLVRRYLRMPV